MTISENYQVAKEYAPEIPLFSLSVCERICVCTHAHLGQHRAQLQYETVHFGVGLTWRGTAEGIKEG